MHALFTQVITEESAVAEGDRDMIDERFHEDGGNIMGKIIRGEPSEKRHHRLEKSEEEGNTENHRPFPPALNHTTGYRHRKTIHGQRHGEHPYIK